ncbi:protein maelstrom [Grus japonensis]|uniref:Protein maelstrom homolog n=1 Tax=Grus japonensis TaxID=30415 RepID=A0ABC9W1D7_GRUJA
MAHRKGSPSPYYFFVRDQLPELQRRGLPVVRVVDAFPYCSQAWATHNLAHPVPACLTTKMSSVTSLPDASATSLKNDQGIVVLKQLILIDKSLPFIDILNAVIANIFYFLNIYSHGKLPSHCEQRFLPCEIGCVKYSIQDGIMADFHHFIDPGIESHLELLAVEDLVIELYQKKYQKEPSKTWVCRELDVFLWDFSSNTSYCISKSLAGVYGVSLTAAHLPLQDSDYGESTNTKMVILDAGRFQADLASKDQGIQSFDLLLVLYDQVPIPIQMYSQKSFLSPFMCFTRFSFE